MLLLNWGIRYSIIVDGWGMVNGGMLNGEQGMGNGKWGMGNGQWSMVNGYADRVSDPVSVTF